MREREKHDALEILNEFYREVGTHIYSKGLIGIIPIRIKSSKIPPSFLLSRGIS
jgi:hypothetical protein